MSALYRGLAIWHPIVLRCGLWITIAVLSQFLIDTEKLTQDVVAKWFWLDWMRFIVKTALPGFIVWRTFVDQSLTNHKKSISNGIRSQVTSGI